MVQHKNPYNTDQLIDAYKIQNVKPSKDTISILGSTLR